MLSTFNFMIIILYTSRCFYFILYHLIMVPSRGLNLLICIQLLTPFDLSRRADHFDLVGCQNRIRNSRVMPIQSWGKSGILAYFGLRIGYFGHIY